MHRALVVLIVAASPALSQRTVTVGSASANPGTRAYGSISVPAGSDSALRIDVAVINGARPGKTVAFVSGSHGTEYTSIVAMQRLIGRIDPNRLSGTVIVVPLVNVASFETMTPHVNPIDRKGMNSGYPGDPSGTQTDRALALIARDVVAPADVVVDLHGGDLDEDLRPYSYWFRVGRAAEDSASRALALAFGLDHIIVSDVDPTKPGRSLSGYALVNGKTIVVAEAGRSGIVAPSDVDALINGSLNVLGALGMMVRHVTPVRAPVWLSGAGERIAATREGVFFAAVPRDTRVTKGQLLGRTTDFVGRPMEEIRSPIDGLVTFIRGVPSMWPRATLVNVAPVLSTPGPWKVK